MFPSKEMLQTPNEMVQVVVRSRPLSEKEKCYSHCSVVKVMPFSNVVEIYDPKYEELDHCKKFVFDSTYDFECTNHEIYEKSVQPLILAVLNGFNSTIFAYGQSGAGKTHTMEGVDNDEGLISKSFEDIFINISKSCNMQYLVRASYLEIYQDEIKDLLSKNHKKCELRENKCLGNYVNNLSSFVCRDIKQMKTLMNIGKLNRVVGKTDMNDRSSRSHAVLTITIEMHYIENPKNHVRVGKLNLVDLAGSERQNKTNAEGLRLREASKINLSLTALGNVISALSGNKSQFIPYRDSKLTRLLKNSLGGNSKTLMIANISPASCNYDESLNTLRFASRARNIKNEPVINEDPVDALLRKYQEEIEKLKSQLAKRGETRNNHRSRNRIKGKSPKSFTPPDLAAYSGQSIPKIVENANESQETFSSCSECSCSLAKEFSNQIYVDDLSKRIESMESKLLTGSSSMSLFDHTCELQKTLTAKNDQIKEIEAKEKEVQKLIVFHVESTEEIKEGYITLQQEVETESMMLLKMLTKLKNVQQQINEAKAEFNEDRRELETTGYEMLKDLKLRLLIMENFIPKQDRRRILSRLIFDEEIDDWKTTPYNEPDVLNFRPKTAGNVRRPVSLFSLITQRKVNHNYRCHKTQENRDRTFRFKGENLLELDLLQYIPTVKDYQPFKLAKLHSSLRAKLHEEDISIDAANFPYHRTNGDRLLRSLFNSTNDKENATKPVYPRTRGLVPK